MEVDDNIASPPTPGKHGGNRWSKRRRQSESQEYIRELGPGW